ncbi:MAG: DUF1018 domain-containing protein [Clostridia bacterium]|nr:DUF1018 domain-containing protein [Clostridia bacterium]
MAAITKGQIQRVYALASGIGILERGSHDDDLHALVYRLTGKTSISELTDQDFRLVERELMQLMRLSEHPAPLKTTGRKKDEEAAGMMTRAQQGLAWRLIYRLGELDGSKAAPGDRMCGAIKKILNIDAGLEAPMRWVSFDNGAKLIEQLKRYVRSAERRAKKEVC